MDVVSACGNGADAPDEKIAEGLSNAQATPGVESPANNTPTVNDLSQITAGPPRNWGESQDTRSRRDGGRLRMNGKGSGRLLQDDEARVNSS
jgi:hypothetical protein